MVEGNEGEDEAAELIDQGEDAEDTPVGEPVLVVLVIILRLEGLDASVGRIDDSQDDCEDLASHSDQNDEWWEYENS